MVNGKAVAIGIPGGGKDPLGGSIPGVPLGRAATPDEAANGIILCVYSLTAGDLKYNSADGSLISPLASFVSGHTLEVAGGSGI